MRPTPAAALAVVLPLLLAACGSPPSAVEVSAPRPDYPASPTGATVDDYHGVEVADPYRWLEDMDAPATRAWVAAQGAFAERFLAALPARAPIRERLTRLWNHPRTTAPERHGEFWVWTHNDGLQNQAVLYRDRSPDGSGQVLLDPNRLSEDGTVALGATAFSHDGSLLAYSVSRSGSDWREWFVLDVASGERRDDHLQWSKFAGAAWPHDNSGFYYVRYPEPPAGAEYAAINEGPQLCFHHLGAPQQDDEIVYERPDQPRWGFAPLITDDGRHLLIEIREGTDRRRRWAWLDLEAAERGVLPLLSDFDGAYDFVGSSGTRFYFRTDVDAPRGRVVAFDRSQPEPEHWTEVLPQTDATLADVHLLGDRLIAVAMRDAHHVVTVHTLDGKPERELALPTLGAVGGFEGPAADTVTFFTFTSFTHPPTVYRLDVTTGETSLFRAPQVAFDPDAFVSRQVFLQSRDGTRLPMFLVHRRDLALDGRNRTYLYAYGGFNISLLPRFSPDNIAWLERGGIYAQPTLRGGGEYGESWHAAGMLEHKQNVFDDFIAAAEYLIRNGYSSPSTLAIGGGSNGGLLVGACLTQRPDLFGAAVPAVGVLDMLRYHRFTIGWAWVPEYGSADDAAQFRVLHAYSPLHNVHSGTAYPPTLIMTSDHDDRVVPAHSFKFAAALQQAQAGPGPILLRVETKSGHGAGTPLSKRVEAAADRWAFLEAVLTADGP